MSSREGLELHAPDIGCQQVGSQCDVLSDSCQWCADRIQQDPRAIAIAHALGRGFVCRPPRDFGQGRPHQSVTRQIGTGTLNSPGNARNGSGAMEGRTDHFDAAEVTEQVFINPRCGRRRRE